MSINNVICGQVVGNSGDGFFSSAVISHFQDCAEHIKHDYNRKAAVSTNSLFYPYSCDPSGTINNSGIYEQDYYNMPHFLTPTSGAEEPTAHHLHPFNSGHDIGFTTHSSGVDHAGNLNPIAINYPDRETYRGMALRGPIVITGPCYDVNGDPYPAVPSGEIGDPVNSGFINNYMNRSDLWATGPLDVRFDPDRGVYVAGSTGATKLVAIVLPTGEEFDGLVNTYFNGFGNKRAFNGVNYRVQEFKLVQSDEVGGQSYFTKTGSPFIATNFKNNIIMEEQLYLATKVNGGWVISNNNQFEGFNL